MLKQCLLRRQRAKRHTRRLLHRQALRLQRDLLQRSDCVLRHASMLVRVARQCIHLAADVDPAFVGLDIGAERDDDAGEVATWDKVSGCVGVLVVVEGVPG